MARTHRFSEVTLSEVNGSREGSPVSIAETRIHFNTRPERRGGSHGSTLPVDCRRGCGF
jgi:hypothetical protein